MAKKDSKDRGSKNRGDSNSGGFGGADERRIRRVEREMREVIATFLLTGFRDELQGLVSVSRVGVGGDLRSAHVFVSVMGAPGDAKASLEILQNNAYDVQSEINRRLQMKFVPKIKFVLDESMDNVLKVEKILRDISDQNAAKDSSAKLDDLKKDGHQPDDVDSENDSENDQ